jgi:hypothetical protein
MRRPKFRRRLKLVERHIVPTAGVLLIGATVSAVSYLFSLPEQIWVDGMLAHSKNYSAQLNGFPLPFVHTTCTGANLSLTCSQYLDRWGFILNSILWAAVIGLAWVVFKRVEKRIIRKHGR